jgi:hypothetical protein
MPKETGEMVTGQQTFQWILPVTNVLLFYNSWGPSIENSQQGDPLLGAALPKLNSYLVSIS